MKLPFESLQVSQPEVIYARLEEPGNPDPALALGGLVKVLEMEFNPWDEPHVYDLDHWRRVSYAMQTHDTAIEIPALRAPLELGNKLLGLLEEYPWLHRLKPQLVPSRQDGHMRMGEFFGLAHDHIFDDLPGLFGITWVEGLRMRAAATEARRLDTEAELAAKFDYDLYP